MDVPRRVVLAQLAGLAACVAGPPALVRPPKPQPPAKKQPTGRVRSYDLRIELDPATRAFRGELDAVVAASDEPELQLDAAHLAIERVEVDGASRSYEIRGDLIAVDLQRAREGQRVSIAYTAQSSEGLRVFDDQAYTGFDTRRWMPCDFRPGSRATFQVAVRTPEGWATVGAAPQRLTEPYSAYLHGFAAGDFVRTTAPGKPALELLATRRAPKDASRCLEVVAEMMRWLERTSGVSYPFERFTIVLAAGSVMQEKAGFAILRDDYALEWLADEREDWLFCHELAHAWWGNLVTCESWSHFWLNEAFATAMTAFYKEARWGAGEYERERALARRRVLRMLRSGKGRPLELARGAAFQEAGGPWSYTRGLEVLHEVRAALGAEAFARATRAFVARHALAGVTTDDFLDAYSKERPALRPAFASLVREAPTDADWVAMSKRPREELVGIATGGGDASGRLIALDVIAERAAREPSGEAAEVAALEALERDPNRAIARAAMLHLRRSRAGFWTKRRRGANAFNQVEDEARLRAAREAGIEFLRLAPNKWRSMERDFLLGDTASFDRLVREDLAELVRVLDVAARVGVPILLTTLSLPGARWKQQNGDQNDVAAWASDELQAAAARFWRELASAVGGHDAIVGYDILNEPRPEVAARIFDTSHAKYRSWSASAKDTTADVNRFYRRVVAAIRAVDPSTPIVVESSMDASPGAFEFLEPIDDDGVLHSFHVYEPWLYVSHQNGGRYRYPGPIPADEEDPKSTETWNRARLHQALDPVQQWMERHKVIPERVLAGELGCFRKNPGAAAYLEDVVSIVEEMGVHWAFYSFREDEWDGMDYELGASGVVRSENPMWRVLRSRLSRTDGARPATAR